MAPRGLQNKKAQALQHPVAHFYIAGPQSLKLGHLDGVYYLRYTRWIERSHKGTDDIEHKNFSGATLDELSHSIDEATKGELHLLLDYEHRPEGGYKQPDIRVEKNIQMLKDLIVPPLPEKKVEPVQHGYIMSFVYGTAAWLKRTGWL